MEAGNLEEAYEAFLALDGYKDSTEQAEKVYYQMAKIRLQMAKKGDYVIFGKYEQDNNTDNGKEDIEWLVLEVTDGKALVISKYALDCKKYNTSLTDVTWETCTLRKWLNSDFLNSAFTVGEKAVISTVTVPSDVNPTYNTATGNETQDRLFLLSITEVKNYFSTDNKRWCEPTNYAVANGAYVNSDNGNCWWWLRSPGIYQFFAAVVGDSGDIRENGRSASVENTAVRPAMWIDLSKFP